MKEREVEKMLVDGIRKLGGRAFKWVSPGNDGVPDRIVVLPGLPAIFVELKTITGRLTSLQRVQLKRLKDFLASFEEELTDEEAAAIVAA